MTRNDTDQPMKIDGDEHLLQPGHVRLYEMFHFYKDIPIEEYEKECDDPLYKLLVEEIRKEIDKEIINTIARNVK